MAELEKSGIPTVCYSSPIFAADHKASARAHGVPAMPQAIIPFPLTNAPPDKIREAVAQIIDQTIAGLTQQPDEREAAQARAKPAETITFSGEDLLECVARFNEEFLGQEWGDGLPLVPPTPKAVERMLKGTNRHPGDIVVPAMPPGNGIATVEKIAINAVMAGCRPEYFPVVLAAAEAYEGLGHIAYIQSVSTGPAFPAVLINGPIREKLGFNSGCCALGPGKFSFPNIVVGRSLSLIKINIGQNQPRRLDMDTIGTANKFSFCVAENEEAADWKPYHVERGFDKDVSTVTVMYLYPGPELQDWVNHVPEKILDSWCTLTSGYSAGASIGRWLFGGRTDPKTGRKVKEVHLILVAPEHAQALSQNGWPKDRVRAYLHEKSRIPFKRLVNHRSAEMVKQGGPENAWLYDYPDLPVPISPSPDCFMPFTVGGEVGRSQFYFGAGEPSIRPIEGYQ